ncbi:MAG: conserved repeat domain protein [Deltaproteobacteria bacterium]|nr:conserved repeat domain protein [Deltaproteobacteria bacterium]
MPGTGIHANTPKYLLSVFLLLPLFLPVSTALAAPAGTLITNQATATFQDANANSFTALSNTTTVTVTSVYTVSVTSPPDASGGQNTVVYYPYLVTNTGNDNNTFTLAAATGSALPNNWTATIYFDANGNGVRDPGENTVTNSTGVLAPNGTYRFLVGVTILLAVPDGAQDDTTLNVTGTGPGAGATAQDNVVTTVVAPNLSIVKDVRNVTLGGGFAATANAAPSQILEYRLTVTNGGAAAATAVVLTDPDHTWTTYVAGTIWIGSNGVSSGPPNVLQDDNNSGAETCAIPVCGIANATAGGLITANLGNGATELVGGSLPPGTTVYVYFQVRVD